MNITLPLSPEDQSELERRAAAVGTDIPGYVLELVREQVAPADNGDGEAGVPYEQWSREFQAWVSSHLPRNPGFDDSRESIYD